MSNVFFRRIASALRSSYPDITLQKVVRNERIDGSSQTCYINSIAGLSNFSRGRREYCTVIAFADHGRLVDVLILDHTRDEFMAVSKGSKAVGTVGSLRVSDSHDPATALVGIHGSLSQFSSNFEQSINNIRQTDCLELDLLALGQRNLDCIVASKLSPFQMEFATLVGSGIGAVCSDWLGRRFHAEARRDSARW